MCFHNVVFKLFEKIGAGMCNRPEHKIKVKFQIERRIYLTAIRNSSRISFNISVFK